MCWASLELGCRRPVVLSERSCMGVRDSIGCERPVVLSEKFCMGVRDTQCNPKSSIT